jgi:hypothetical protein
MAGLARGIAGADVSGPGRAAGRGPIGPAVPDGPAERAFGDAAYGNATVADPGSAADSDPPANVPDRMANTRVTAADATATVIRGRCTGSAPSWFGGILSPSRYCLHADRVPDRGAGESARATSGTRRMAERMARRPPGRAMLDRRHGSAEIPRPRPFVVAESRRASRPARWFATSKGGTRYHDRLDLDQ